MYRLLADILNDIAFILDCLSPIFPKAVRVVILSFSSVLRALCGVAAGSAKASLSAHFAKWGNLGELNAKDSSQETVISLLGMLVGSVVVSWVTTPMATWTTLILLLSIHLETNRRAVRAVKMRTMNRQRATLVYHHLRKGHVPTSAEIAAKERIFEWDGVLRGPNDEILGHCSMGTSMSRFVQSMSVKQNRATKSSLIPASLLRDILAVYSKAAYLIWYDKSGRPTRLNVLIKEDARPVDLLVAWWEGLCTAMELDIQRATNAETTAESTSDNRLDLLKRSQLSVRELFEKYYTQLKDHGWDMDEGALEAPSSVRIKLRE
jgi:hypothetical protein